MMFSTKFIIVLIPVTCVLIVTSQPSQKFFRKDYQYISSTKAFYKIHTIKKSWPQAKEKCELEGSQLFYPKNEDEANSVISFWNETQPFSAIHIGISASHSKHVFETVEGFPISSVYNVWAPGEPNDANGREDCVSIYKNGLLNDSPCNVAIQFICKKTLDSLEWNEKCNLPDLEYKYSEKLGKCYKFHLKPMNWADAYGSCHIEQTYLAIINTQDEADHFVDMTSKAEKDEVNGDYLRGAVHLGFKEKDGNWTTIFENTPLSKVGYNNWGSNQPDGKGKEKCGSMFYNGKLNDIDCDEKLFFICEHEI